MVFKKGHKPYFSWKGRKFSEEHKRKLIESHMGIKQSKETILKRVESRKGYRHSEKTKEKMRENNKGWFKKGHKVRKGSKLSYESRKKISATNQGIGVFEWNDFKGSLSRRLRSSSKWKIWRELVFLRDNFTCQNLNCKYCDNKIGVMLHPHHIKFLSLYPELAFKVDNGITYCAEYHINSKELHKKDVGFLDKYIQTIKEYESNR